MLQNLQKEQWQATKILKIVYAEDLQMTKGAQWLKLQTKLMKKTHNTKTTDQTEENELLNMILIPLATAIWGWRQQAQKTKKGKWIQRNDEWQGKLSEDFVILYNWQDGEEQGRSTKNVKTTGKW